MRLQSAALAGERRPAHGGDAVEVAAQRGGHVGVGAQFLDLPVDAGARAARLGALDLGRPAAMYDVTSSRSSASEWASVRASWVCSASVTRSWESLELTGGGEDGGGTGPGDGGGHDGHGDDRAGCVRGCGRPLPVVVPVRAGRALRARCGAVCLPVRRGRVFCTGARIPDS